MGFYRVTRSYSSRRFYAFLGQHTHVIYMVSAPRPSPFFFFLPFFASDVFVYKLWLSQLQCVHRYILHVPCQPWISSESLLWGQYQWGNQTCRAWWLPWQCRFAAESSTEGLKSISVIWFVCIVYLHHYHISVAVVCPLYSLSVCHYRIVFISMSVIIVCCLYNISVSIVSMSVTIVCLYS